MHCTRFRYSVLGRVSARRERSINVICYLLIQPQHSGFVCFLMYRLTVVSLSVSSLGKGLPDSSNLPHKGVFSQPAAKSLQSCPTLCNPIDGSPLGFPVPGILQARILEWVAISFSNA